MSVPHTTPADLPPELANHPRYRILKELGRGGMGVVYQAEQTMMDRTVAVKVISRALLEHPGALERFHREVRAAAKLTHPNIVIAHDAERVGDLHMLVMEYVEGQSLAQALKRKGPLPVAHACHYVRQAALGLQHALEHDMVHRDIKPQNLMLTPKGQVKILDFGLAKVASERGKGQGLTASNAYMGTPDYSAPEQATDARSADIRADIYSLGCTLYCLLAGRPPFDEPTDVLTILAHLGKEPRPLPELRPDVPAELWAVVRRMLAKAPAERYQKPAEVAQALVPFIKQGSKAAPVTAGPSVAEKPTLPPHDTSRPPAVAIEETPFEGLTLEEPPRKRAQRTAAPPPAPSRGWLLAGAAAAAVAVIILGAVLVAGIVLRTKTPQGTVVLDIDHDGAEVAVDGRRWTVTVPGDREPIRIELPAGQHELKVTKGGFEAFTRKVTIKSGKTEHITAELVENLAAAAPTPPPPPPAPVAKPPEPATSPAPAARPPAPPTALPAGFVALFNGRDLAGWTASEGSRIDRWAAENGVLYTTGEAGGGWLMTEKEYGDFDLLLEYQVAEGGNSGVAVHSPLGGRPSHDGMEIQILDNAWYLDAKNYRAGIRPTQLTGAVWGVVPPSKDATKPAGAWNQMHITSKGRHLTVQINGTTVTDADLDDYKDHADEYPGLLRRKGHLGLQCDTGMARFRNLAVKELAPDEEPPAPPPARLAPDKPFVSLFNGKDLKGWEVYPGGTGEWKVRGGVLIGSGKNSHLFTKRGDYTNFVYRVEAAINDGGNSGQYFRTQFGPGFPKGYEAQINSTHRDPIRTGSLYPAFNPKLSPEEREKIIVRKELVRPGEWFTQEVIADGNHIIIKVNGQKTVDFVDENNTYTKGRLALQQHDPGTVVKFRKIEIKELPPAAAGE